MAKITIAHHPELTVDGAIEVFRDHFAGKYEVRKTRDILSDFELQKSAGTGVKLKLRQDRDGTRFTYTASVPSFLLRLFFVNLTGWLFLRSSWKELEEEVGAFIENAPEFK